MKNAAITVICLLALMAYPAFGVLPTGLGTRSIGFVPSVFCFEAGCLNSAHPLSTGLVSYLVPSMEWVLGIGDSSGNGTGIAVTGSITQQASFYGTCVSGFSHSSNYLSAINQEITARIPSGAAGRTYAALVQMTSTTFSTYAPLLFSGTCGATGEAFEIGLDNSGTVCSNCAWIADNGYGATVAWTADLNWHLVIGTFPGTSTNATDMKVYIDGRAPSPGSIGSNNTVNTTTGGNLNLLMGDSSGGCTGAATNARISAAWIWNRALTPAEIQLFVSDPFGMTQQGQLRFGGFNSGVVSGGFVANPFIISIQ